MKNMVVYFHKYFATNDSITLVMRLYIYTLITSCRHAYTNCFSIDLVYSIPLRVQSFTYLGQLVSLSQMMVKAKEKSEVELVLLKMHSQRDINF